MNYNELTEAEKNDLAKRISDQRSWSPSRRNVLKGVAGAAGLAALTGQAGADPDFTSAAGRVGTEDRPFDSGAIKDLSTETLDTEQLTLNGDTKTSWPSGGASGIQAAKDGYVVPVAPGLSADDAIDPTSTTTPIQDAHDAIGGPGGSILLPPTTVTEDSTFTWSDGDKSLLGWGRDSVVEFADLDAPGIDWQSVRNYIDGVQLSGSDGGNRTSPVLQVSGSNRQSLNMGRVWFSEGGGPAVVDISAANPFSSHWQSVSFQGGSNQSTNISGKFGVGCSIGNLYLGALLGAGTVTGMKISGNVVIDTINVGGTIGTAVDHYGGATGGDFRAGTINYETGESPTAAVRLGSVPSAFIGGLHVTTGTPTYGVELYDSGGGAPANKVIGYIQPGSGIGTARVHLATAMPSNTELGSLYYGPSTGVADDSGSTNGTLRCLQDNTTVG